MKQKKGFTLIELLAVIGILGILGTIATTSAINISQKLKKEMLCDTLEFISSAGKTYGSDIFDGLDEEGLDLTVGELVQKGYLKKDQVVNPVDQNSMDEVVVHVYRKNNRAYAHVFYEAPFCEE